MKDIVIQIKDDLKIKKKNWQQDKNESQHLPFSR